MTSIAILSYLPVAPLAWGMPGPMEMILIAGLGLLLFGKRLPEVGRSLGRSIVEFKRGLKGVNDEIEEESSRPGLPAGESRKQIATSGDQAGEA